MTQRARRKLRALKRAVEPASTVQRLLASALVGYELCARRTTDENVRTAVKNAATSLAKLVGPRKARTSERLRWEYVASTGALMQGGADARLLAECARILGDAIAFAPTDDRVRVASAEAWSLAAAVAPMRRAATVPVFT